jgi:hypothetical protein
MRARNPTIVSKERIRAASKLLKKDFFQIIEMLRENETAFSPATNGS